MRKRNYNILNYKLIHLSNPKLAVKYYESMEIPDIKAEPLTKESIRDLTEPKNKVIQEIKKDIQKMCCLDISPLTFTFETNN